VACTGLAPLARVMGVPWGSFAPAAFGAGGGTEAAAAGTVFRGTKVTVGTEGSSASLAARRASTAGRATFGDIPGPGAGVPGEMSDERQV